jgi:hypothetical protein
LADDPKGVLERLDRELDDLRHQYELFFSGGRKSEPTRDRTDFETALRKHGQRAFVNTQDQFRFNSIQARYYSFANHWTRTVRDMEEGRLARDAKGRLARPAPPARGAADRIDPIDPAHLEEAAFSLASARSECGLPGGNLADLDGLKNALLSRAREIAERADGKQVEFRISVEDGKPKIKAVLK